MAGGFEALTSRLQCFGKQQSARGCRETLFFSRGQSDLDIVVAARERQRKRIAGLHRLSGKFEPLGVKPFKQIMKQDWKSDPERQIRCYEIEGDQKQAELSLFQDVEKRIVCTI